MIYFATSNPNKVKEVQEILEEVEHFPFDHNEIRSDDAEEIAREAVEAAYSKLKKPVFVEDSGLFIEGLKGFPGTYSGWVQKKIGSKGILKLMNGIKNRNAEFRCSIAYIDENGIKIITERCKGEISLEERGKSGFGYDPIFIPEGNERTFAESIELKTKLSHRYKAIIELKKYLKNKA